MTPKRLRRLIDAYGADTTRWPEHPDDANIDLSAALALDKALDAFQVAEPPVALVARIIASAPLMPLMPLPVSTETPQTTPQTTPIRRRRRLSGLRWWVSGVGLLGAGLAGVAAGAFALSLTGASALALNHGGMQTDWHYGGTVFSSPASDLPDSE